MLIKKELETIGILPLPKVKAESTGTKSYITAVDVVELPKSGRVLVADLYRVKDKSHAARFFSDGKTYYTVLEWPAKSWTKCNPAKSYWYGCYSVSLKSATETAEQFLGTKGKRSYRSSGALGAIDVFVTNLSEDKREQAEHRKQLLQQQHFAMYPKYPADLEEYCDHNLFETGYVFYEKLTKTGRRYGRCSCCGEKYRLPRDVRHNNRMICPKCGADVVLKAVFHVECMEEHSRICITANVEKQLLIRWVDVTRVITNKGKRSYTFSDYAYNLYLRNGKKETLYAYEHKTIPCYYGKTWKRHSNGTQNFSRTALYTNNLDEVFGSRYYNVDLKAALHGRKEKICFTELLNNLKNCPAAEYLVKLGLTQLAEMATTLVAGRVIKKTGFSEVMQISKQFLPMYQALNVDYYEHCVIQRYGGWVSTEDMVQYRRLGLGSDTDIAKSLLRTMSFGKFVCYFNKQMQLKGRTAKHLLIQYRDYINMAKDLKLDLTRKGIRIPEDISEAHDLILREFNKLKFKNDNEAFIKAVKPIYAKLPISSFENEDFCIVFPQLRSDFVTEGGSLNHCVGSTGYCNNHMKGKSMIFFIRRRSNPDKAFFTMELDMVNKKIVQIRGYGNKEAPAEVRKFAEAFMRKVIPTAKTKKGRNAA